MFVKLIILSAICCVLAVAESNESDLVKLINNIDNEKSLYLFGGLSVEKIDNGRSFEATSTADNFIERTKDYLESHKLSLALSKEENRSSKLKKLVLPLLLALKFKMAVIVPALLLLIKFISVKALMSGMLALVFSGAMFIRDLVHQHVGGKKQERVTTAYITGNPISAEIVHSGWDRTGQNTAQDMAYNGYQYSAMPQHL